MWILVWRSCQFVSSPKLALASDRLRFSSRYGFPISQALSGFLLGLQALHYFVIYIIWSWVLNKVNWIELLIVKLHGYLYVAMPPIMISDCRFVIFTVIDWYHPLFNRNGYHLPVWFVTNWLWQAIGWDSVQDMVCSLSNVMATRCHAADYEEFVIFMVIDWYHPLFNRNGDNNYIH